MSRSILVMALALLALLGLTSLVWADATADQVKAKCQQIDDEVAKLLQLKQELLQLTGQPAPAPKKSWTDWVKINGYFQARYLTYPDPDTTLYDASDAGKNARARDQFDLSRMYINLIATPNDRTQAVVTWARIGAGAYDTNWAQVFVDYKIDPEWTARVGMAPTAMGIENPQSSTQRLAFQYAAFLAGSYSNAPRGIFFSGPWDKGAWLTYTPPDRTGLMPQAIFSVTNGQFREKEQNNNKNLALDLKWKPKWGEVGLSWMDGRWTDDTGSATTNPHWMVTDPRRYVLGAVRWDPTGPFALQTEAASGSMFGDNFSGWYGQLEWAVPNTQGTLFTKYESYDPPNTLAGVGTDEYEAWHFGYALWLDKDKYNRLTVQYTNGELGSRNRDELGLQWQSGF